MKRNKVQAVQTVPIVVYDNGKTLARATLGSGRFGPQVGFRTEVGQHEHLDAALAELGIKQIEVKHQREGGAEVKRHWFLGEQLRFFPLTEGPVAPTITASLHPRSYQATLSAGLGLRWGDGEKSRLAVRGYLDTLGAAGIVEPVQLVCRSRMTDRLLAALLDHGRVCEAADALRPDGLSEMVSFCDLALVLGPGEEEEFGKGDTATVSPLRSLHPAEVDAAYIAQIWRPDAVAVAAPRHWPEVQAWALGFANPDQPPPTGPSNDSPAGDEDAEAELQTTEAQQRVEAATPATQATTARRGEYDQLTPEEAEQRFFARYGEVIGSNTWQGAQRYLGHLLPKPKTVAEWLTVAEEVRDKAFVEKQRQAADPNQTIAAELLGRMLAAAAQMGLSVQLPDGWARLPVDQIASHGRALRATMKAAIAGAWEAERQAGGKTPPAELRADLNKAAPEQLAELHATILARLQSAHAAA